MIKILLLVDNRGWAYDTKARALIDNYRGSDFEFEIVGYKDDPEQLTRAFSKNDYYLCFGFQNFNKCERRHGADRKKALASIASHASWDKGKTQPDNQVLPDRAILNYLSTFKSVSSVSKRLQKLFKKAGLRTTYTPNGVPTNQFTPNISFANPKKLIIGYAGRDRDDKKGNRSFIIPAAKSLRKHVSLELAMCDFILERKKGIRGSTYRNYTDMPNFYRNLDIYICMSREEGSCRSVLEAMASGCAIISTDCGAIHELISDGDGGLIVDRNLDSLVKGLQTLLNDRDLVTKMKIRNSKAIKNFDWSVVANQWYAWLEETLCRNQKN